MSSAGPDGRTYMTCTVSTFRHRPTSMQLPTLLNKDAVQRLRQMCYGDRS